MIQDRFMKTSEVVHLTGLSISTITRMEKRGEFPRRVKLARYRVGWPESAIEEWFYGKIKSCAKSDAAIVSIENLTHQKI